MVICWRAKAIYPHFSLEVVEALALTTYISASEPVKVSELETSMYEWGLVVEREKRPHIEQRYES